MKLTILKQWMVTLVIIFLYFNIGIQATEENQKLQKMFLEKGDILKKGTLALPKHLDFELDHLILIGIGGPTTSGKTTFNSKLANYLKSMQTHGVITLEMDYFFETNSMEIVVLNNKQREHNWETPEAVDWVEISKFLIKENERAKKELPENKKRIIIINGFLCFNQKWLRNKYSFSIYFEIDYETCKYRRFTTKPCGGNQYFDRCIWQGYQDHGQFPTDLPSPSCKFSGVIPSNEIWKQFQEQYLLQLSEILIDAFVIEQITKEKKETVKNISVQPEKKSWFSYCCPIKKEDIKYKK